MTAHASLTMGLELSGVVKRYGSRHALDDVSFSLPEGASLVVFGPNGAGKTTLLRVVSTLERPSAGTIRVCGHDVKEDALSARERIGLVSHEPMVYLDLTALENLEFYARLYGLQNPREHARKLLGTVGLSHRANDVVRGFSRGMKQRVAIARALIGGPELLLLDEPYAGLDPQAARVVDALFDGKPETQTIVSVSHDVSRGLALSTHALVLMQGAVAYFGPSGNLDPEVLSCMLRGQGRGRS